MIGLLAEDKGPGGIERRRLREWQGALKDECATGLDDRRLQGNGGSEAHLITDFELLQLGDDTIGAVDVKAEEVLELVVAIEASPPLTELNDPRPDNLGAAANRDRPRCRHIRVDDQLIARLYGDDLASVAPQRSTRLRPQPTRAAPAAAATATAVARATRPGRVSAVILCVVPRLCSALAALHVGLGAVLT